MRGYGLLLVDALAAMTFAGLKTNTRRIMDQPFQGKPYEGEIKFEGVFVEHSSSSGAHSYARFSAEAVEGGRIYDDVYCPLSGPGEHLYLRETYYEFGHWAQAEGQLTKKKKHAKWRFVPAGDRMQFHPPANYRRGRRKADGDLHAWYKRSARFMPTRYARCWLKISEIKLERVQDISEADARAEGVVQIEHQWRGCEYPLPNVAYMATQDSTTKYSSAKDAFKELWVKVYGNDAWKTNPWVWVVKFSKIDN